MLVTVSRRIIDQLPTGLKTNSLCCKAYEMLRHVYGVLLMFRLKFTKLHLYYSYNSHRIKRFKNIHKGQRCFIVATGPSLNRTNLSLIKDEIIFGVNTLYTGLSRFGIKCDYYFVGDGIVWQKHHENIMKLDTTLFINVWPAQIRLSNMGFRQIFRKDEPFVMKEMEGMWSTGRFSKDISKGIYGGRNVVASMCTQAAYYMGFTKVYLLGVDCDYSGIHRFDGSVTDNLAGDGVKNDWKKTFESYKICKGVFEEDGREIINATVGGKLEVFRREKLEDVVKDSGKSSRAR